jgi:hypothetical protein
MGLVPQAVFYFEAETNIKSLVLQRRRWINGTWAGYWYLAIQHPSLIFNCKFVSIHFPPLPLSLLFTIIYDF